MKMGVYIASHNNPVFLRHCLLQLEAQHTYCPQVLAIYENGQRESGKVFWMDVLNRIMANGTKVIHEHTPLKLQPPYFHYIPLKQLLDEGCDLFTKFDHDDIFYEDHLFELITASTKNDVDYVIRTQADVLVLKTKGNYVSKLNMDFGIWNPTGGMSDAIMFNRRVAARYLEEMGNHASKQDDAILADDVLPHFRGLKQKSHPTTCYVSHGKNTSTPLWALSPPAEITK